MDNTQLICPQCGAPMTLSSDKSEAVCDYCGNKIIVPREPSSSEKIRLAKEISYANEMGRQEALKRSERDRRRKKRKERFLMFMGLILALIIVFPLFCKTFLGEWISRPEIDPFDYVTITFSGTNGSGMPHCEKLKDKDDIDTVDLKFEFTPAEDLSEADIVTVTASSVQNKYRLTSHSKQYTVEGLQLYLTDLNSLEDEQLQMIFSMNSDLQTRNMDMLTSDVQISPVTPVRLCLLTDNYRVSELYVISEITCSLEDVSATHYLISYMEGVIAGDGKISWQSCMYAGESNPAVDLGMAYNYKGGFLCSYTSLESAITYIKTRDTSLEYSERELE